MRIIFTMGIKEIEYKGVMIANDLNKLGCVTLIRKMIWH